jgi:CDP-glycerol glycerophosphotransferase (TagB/SpsB family)
VPVVYFQFDQEEYIQHHTERPGYFEYPRDGFGPVTDTVEDTVAAITGGLAGPNAEYIARMERAFPLRDGRNRERVFGAMQEAARKRPLAERLTRAAVDRW